MMAIMRFRSERGMSTAALAIAKSAWPGREEDNWSSRLPIDRNSPRLTDPRQKQFVLIVGCKERFCVEGIPDLEFAEFFDITFREAKERHRQVCHVLSKKRGRL